MPLEQFGGHSGPGYPQLGHGQEKRVSGIRTTAQDFSATAAHTLGTTQSETLSLHHGIEFR